MPRPNPLRSIDGEKALAQRIAYEREERGWTYAGLASRMTSVGCPIQASALYKIEKSNPPRGISVDELIALKRVFELELDDLVQPMADKAGKQLRHLMVTMQGLLIERQRLDAEFKVALTAVQKFVADHPQAMTSMAAVANFNLADLKKAVEIVSQFGDIADAEKDVRASLCQDRANKRKAES